MDTQLRGAVANDLKEESDREAAEAAAQEAAKQAEEEAKAAAKAAKEARKTKAAEDKAAFEANVARKRQ